ncbi:MAG: hypothetical protein JWO86_2584 [Myxococcaceae bacterium]|nr:hypothetical protein [Myxococcaceae bacterium]
MVDVEASEAPGAVAAGGASVVIGAGVAGDAADVVLASLPLHPVAPALLEHARIHAAANGAKAVARILIALA